MSASKQNLNSLVIILHLFNCLFLILGFVFCITGIWSAIDANTFINVCEYILNNLCAREISEESSQFYSVIAIGLAYVILSIFGVFTIQNNDHRKVMWFESTHGVMLLTSIYMLHFSYGFLICFIIGSMILILLTFMHSAHSTGKEMSNMRPNEQNIMDYQKMPLIFHTECESQ